MDTTVPKEHAEKVCRIGQGKFCCSYLVAGAEGFECAKRIPGIKEQLDARRAQQSMVAMSDNCEGPPSFNIIEGVCRVCGCTDNDCRQCIERTGEPCHWVELDLCSACVEVEEAKPVAQVSAIRKFLAEHNADEKEWDEIDRLERAYKALQYAISVGQIVGDSKRMAMEALQ